MRNQIEISANQVTDAFSNKKLELFVLPTEQCNFRCTYCYEDFKIGKMPQHIIEGVKNFISSRANELEILRLQWFGGEPLLAIDVIKDISEYALSLSQVNDFILEGVATTNGSLLNQKTLHELVHLGTRTFQISLDGPSELHNSTRIRGDGKGTFEKIWGNLLAAKETTLPFNIILRIHLTPENIFEMPDFLKRLKDTFLCDKRFIPHLVPIGHLGGKNDSKVSVLSAAEADQVITELSKLINSTDPGNNAEPHICYASKANSLIIRADGRIGKCTVALRDSRNTVGRIHQDGTLEIDNEKLQIWFMGWKDLSLSQLHCPLEHLSQQSLASMNSVSV